MDAERFAGQVAVVTGAGGGIGRATAVRLAAERACVFAVDMDTSTARRTVDDIESAGGTATAEIVDLADPSDRSTVIPRALDRFGRVDILINNAAYLGQRESLFSIGDEDWNRVLETNLTAAMVLSRDAGEDMARRGRGAIINITALQQRLPLLTHAAYGASKGGLAALTRYLAVELSPRGIRVNAIQPAVIATDGADIEPDENWTDTSPATLLGRKGAPEEIAAAVAFLASDEASFITGAELPVDGGRGISRLSDPFAEHYSFPGSRDQEPSTEPSS